MNKNTKIEFEVTPEMVRDLKSGKLNIIVTADSEAPAGFSVQFDCEVRDGQPTPGYALEFLNR